MASSPKVSAVEKAWWANMAVFLLHGTIVGTWVSRIPAVQIHLKLSNSVLGVTLLGSALGAILCIPFTGKLIARRGSRIAVLLSSISFSLALILPGLAVNAATLALGLLLYGAGAAAMDVSMNSQGVAIEKQMGKPVMSRFHAMFSVGGMAGSGLGGWVASRGIGPLPHFAAGAVIFAAVGFSLWPLLIREEASVIEQEHSLSLFRIPPLLLALTAIGFCMLLAEGAIADWTGIYLLRTLRAGPGVAAAGFAVFSGAMAFFRFFGDAVTLRLGSYRTILFASLLSGISLTYILAVPLASWAIPAFVFLGAGMSVIIPLVFGSGGRVAGINPGTGIATVTGLGYFGFIVGPPLIGFLSQQITLRYALGCVVACCFISAYLSRGLKALPAPGSAPAPEPM